MRLIMLNFLMVMCLPGFACHSAIDHGFLAQKSDLVIMGEVTKSVKPTNGGIGFAEIKIEKVFYSRWGMEDTSIVVPTAYTGMSTNDAYQHKKGEKGIWILEFVNDIYVLRNISSKTLVTDREFEKVKSMMINFKGAKGSRQLQEVEEARHKLDEVTLNKKNEGDLLIEKGGDYIWNDGSSFYRLNSDHTFYMGRVLNWGGATAIGTWKNDGENKFIVISKWEPMNGFHNNPNDYRIMELSVRIDYKSKDKSTGYHNSYWQINKLGPTCKAKYDKWEKHFNVKLNMREVRSTKPQK